MRSVQDIISDARQTADFYVERAKDAALQGGEGALLAQLGAQAGSGGYGMANQQTSLQHHLEQYKHFTGWVYSCVDWIASRTCDQPIRVAIAAHPKEEPVVQRGDKPRTKQKKYVNKGLLPNCIKSFHEDLDVLDTHPILDLFNNPNPIMVRWMLIYVTVASLKITGKAYWWFNETKDGEIQIWPVPTWWVEPKHKATADGLYDHWEVKIQGAHDPVPVPKQNIVYFYYPDPSNLLGAVSALQANARAVVADEAISEAQRRVFSNDVFPGTVITVGRHPDTSTPGVAGQRPYLSEAQRRQLLHAIKVQYRGVQHYGEPMILDALIQEIKRLQTNVREMDFMASSKFTKQRVCQGFKVNPILIGEIEGANRASALVAENIAITSNVNPLIELFSEVMTAKVAPLFAKEGENLVLYIEKAKVCDDELRLKEETVMFDRGALSINELRLEHGKPPIHGGDVSYINGQLLPVHIIRETENPPDGEAVMPGGTPDQALPSPSEVPPEPTPAPAEGANNGQANGQANGEAKRLILSTDRLAEWFAYQADHLQ